VQEVGKIVAVGSTLVEEGSTLVLVGNNVVEEEDSKLA
jgi:hypothetical protein